MIAKASQMAKEWICEGASIIARFIGSTRDSTSLHLLLQSICLELSLAYQTDPAAVPQVNYLTKLSMVWTETRAYFVLEESTPPVIQNKHSSKSCSETQVAISLVVHARNGL